VAFWERLGSGLLAAAEQAKLTGARQIYNKNRDQQFGGLTTDQWDGRWQFVGSLHQDFSHYSDSVGLYRADMGGQVAYIGRAIEWNNGGLRKRLRDYTRDSDSSRGHGSGRLMNQHASDLSISVLVVGSDEHAAEITRKLEIMMIGLHQPRWNVQHS
jgi:hypothetical protein